MKKLLLGSIALLAVLTVLSFPSTQAVSTSYLGLVSMGMPTSPQPFMSDAFAITKHTRDDPATGALPMTADHGPDCSAPPATHPVSGDYASMVFVCHDHLMTAIDGSGAGVIAFQPNQLVNFPATVSISRSTRITAGRDWTEFYFVPFADQLAYSADAATADGVQKEAKNFIHVLMRTANGTGNTFEVSERVNGVDAGVDGNDYTTLEQATGLVDSAVTRTPITITISQTHFTLTCNGFTFYDANLPILFPATQVVFQTQHVSYDPEKDGDLPDTWHWSDLSISSATPYYQQMAMPAALGDGLGSMVTFSPAPAGSFLRFQVHSALFDSFSSGYDISFDGGHSWTPWAYQTPEDNFEGSVLQPVPAGATSALLRGASGWYARDFYVMSLNSGVVPTSTPMSTATSTPPPTPAPPTSTPSPTPSPAPGPTPSPTVVPTPAPVGLSNTPCTVTLNGIATSGFCTGTFHH